MFKLFIPIIPYPKRTGTFSRKTGRFFANAKTKRYEAAVNSAIKLKLGSKPIMFPKHTELTLDVMFYMPKPKSVIRLYPTVKPDLSNLIKSFEDALQGALIEGDQQIVNIMAGKRYAESDDQIGINMLLYKYEG